MKLIFLGPPGAGKGTQAEKISERYEIAHISTGDMLRAQMRAGTKLGRDAKAYIDKGELVPDDVILGMIADRIQEPDCAKGFLFDGFPRTLSQAEALRDISDIDMVINIDVPSSALITRISGRRMCKGCGTQYHISTYNKDVCEKCGAELYTRDDDKAETVANRLDVYERQTKPLIEYYEERGMLKSVEGIGTPDEVAARIVAETGKLI